MRQGGISSEPRQFTRVEIVCDCCGHEYDESCVCEACEIERGRRLAVLMFGWMIRG